MFWAEDFPLTTQIIKGLQVDRTWPLPTPTEINQQVSAFGLTESTNGYSAEIELPGFSRENINVTLDRNRIIIKASSTRPGVRLRSIDRAFILPQGADLESVSARYADGILTISVSKHPSAQPRKIAVE
jgi:HSP20 family protein